MTKSFTAILCLCCFSFLTIAKAQAYDWGHVLGGGSDDYIEDITRTAGGNIVVTGSFQGTVDFDPGAGVVNLSAGTTRNTFVCSFSSSGSLVWARSFEGSDDNVAYGLVSDASGNIYVGGAFRGLTDFDPGPGFDTISSSSSNGYLVKLDASGNLSWSGTITSTGYSYVKAMAWDRDSSLFYVGMAYSGADLDPTTGVDFHPATAGMDVVVGKLRLDGNFVWGKRYGSVVNDAIAKSVDVDDDGNLWTVGTFTDEIDLDPSAASFNVVGIGGQDGFVQKLDGATGGFLWGGSVGGLGVDEVSSIGHDELGNVFIAGHYQATADLDPTIGVSTFTSLISSKDIFAAKLTNAGSHLWSRSAGGNGADIVMDCAVDSVGNFHASGMIYGPCDFDPGPGSMVIADEGIMDYFVFQWTPAGDLGWALADGGSGADRSTCMALFPDGKIALGGYFMDSTDLDPTSGTDYRAGSALADGLLIVFTPDSCASLTLVVDSVADVSCAIGTGIVDVAAMGGTAPYSYLWSTGAVTESISPSSGGIYTVTVADAIGCSRTTSYLVTAPTFPSGYDLEVAMMATPLRPGFPAYIYVDAYNMGCSPVSGEVMLVLDPSVTYVTATPIPVSVSGDTLRWNVSGLTFDTPHFQAIVEILVPVTATAGDSLCFDLSVSPFAGDEEPFDNEHLDQCFEVRNAYDPNDKGVWPQGVCAEHWVQMGTPLNYTIRFQNTGTADAVNVFLLDTLDADLDITTVVVKAHSHLMYTEVLPGNVLRFAFDNIYLPDSTTDEPASHGYLVYEVQPLSLVSSGTQIHNGAAIHFDFNAPVLTNVVMNTYTDSVPPCIPASLNEMEDGLSLFPNPSSGNVTLSTQDRISSVSVWNLMGQKLEVEQVWQSPNEITLSFAGHPAGLYLIRAETAGKVLTRPIWIE